MWVILDGRANVSDADPLLNFFVENDDKNDFKMHLKGRSMPILKCTGVSKDQLIHLRSQIDKILEGK